MSRSTVVAPKRRERLRAILIEELRRFCLLPWITSLLPEFIITNEGVLLKKQAVATSFSILSVVAVTPLL
jgi:hypothetical protein